jgi:hypothetical protein
MILEGPIIAVIVLSGMQISPGHSRSMTGAMGNRYRGISAGHVQDESDDNGYRFPGIIAATDIRFRSA